MTKAHSSVLAMTKAHSSVLAQLDRIKESNRIESNITFWLIEMTSYYFLGGGIGIANARVCVIHLPRCWKAASKQRQRRSNALSLVRSKSAPAPQSQKKRERRE